MAPNPAEGFAVKSTQIAEPDAADRQDWFAMTTAHFKTPILALRIETHISINRRHNYT